MKPFKKCVMLIAVALSMSSLVACGGTPPASGPSNALTDIQKRGTLSIGSSGNNAPTIFKAASGEYQGIDADWAKTISDGLGVKAEWRVLDFKGIIPGIQSKQFDVAMSGLRVTDERKKVIDFSIPYAADDAVVVSPNSMSGINSPNDIAGKSVCVVTGSSNGEQPVKRIGTASEVQSYPGTAETFAGLKAGRCDVLVTGRTLAGDWINKGEGAGYKVSSGGTDCASFAVGIPQGEPELLAAVNKAIQAGLDKGDYDAVAKKWTGDKLPVCNSAS